MRSSDKAETIPLSNAKNPDESVRIKDVEHDPNAAMRRAAARPVRVTSKVGKRVFHITTIRRGDRNDPAWQAALPVTVAALKRRGGRILRLASALQIALRVQATRTSANIFFIEPGRDCLDFAAQRLGGSIGAPALLENALRRSPLVQAASTAAVKQIEAQWQGEVKSQHGRIATLERALKKNANLAPALEKSESALRQARIDQKEAEAAARKGAEDHDAETRALKRRVATLDRALKKLTAQGPARNAEGQPAPEAEPVESAAPESVLI